MARKAIMSFYDWAQYPGVTITGGTFETDFPAENMLTLQPQKVARISGTTVTFSVNLQTTRTIGLIHFQNLVTDPTGTIRVVCGSYDSGTVNSWATDGGGIYSQNLYTALGRPRVFIPPAIVSASSVNVTINGVAEPLMIGFVGVCEIYETPQDLLIGPVLTMMDDSDLTVVPYGSTYINPRAKRRKLDFSLPPLAEESISNNDSFVRALDMALINGKSSPMIVCKYPEDTDNLERNTVWGLISNDVAFTNRFYGYHDATFQITQLP